MHLGTNTEPIHWLGGMVRSPRVPDGCRQHDPRVLEPVRTFGYAPPNLRAVAGVKRYCGRQVTRPPA